MKIGKPALRDLFSMSKDRWVSFLGMLVQKNGALPCFGRNWVLCWVLYLCQQPISLTAALRTQEACLNMEQRRKWNQRSWGYPGIFSPPPVRCSTANCLTLCVFHKNCSHLNSTFPNRLSLPECQFKILEVYGEIISRSHYVHNIIIQTILWTCSMASAFLMLSLYFVPWHWTPQCCWAGSGRSSTRWKRNLTGRCCGPALSQVVWMPKLSPVKQQHILRLAAQLAYEREGGQLMPPLLPQHIQS